MRIGACDRRPLLEGKVTFSMAFGEQGEHGSYWQRQISRRHILRAGSAIGMVGAAGALGIACGSSKKDSGSSSSSSSSGASGGGTLIKVGILHSLSGTLSISEVSVKDSELLAIEEVNAAGGVLGKKIEPVVEDGASDWPTFAQKAQKLLTSDKVAAVFGCWTSVSRKAVLPVFEGLKGLLWYPVQYEGLESSPNIYYMGATTNQQIVPSIEYLLKDGKTKMFLLGSDYVFPRTANRIIKAQLAASGGTTVAEEYTPLGYTDYNTYDHLQQDPRRQAGRCLQHTERRLERRVLQAAQGGRLQRGRPADPLGLDCRGRGPRYRRRHHEGPPRCLELLPDDQDSREREVRGGLQGEVRRQPRH